MKAFNGLLNSNNGRIYIAIATLLCAFVILLTIFFYSNMTLARDIDYEEKNIGKIEKNQKPIDVEKIINNNFDSKLQQEMIVEEIDMEYNTKYQENKELAKGVVQVLQEGRAGRKKVTIIRKYKDNDIISEEVISEGIIRAPIDRIVDIGISDMYNAYAVSEGDEVLIVTNSVSVRLQPDEKSEKIYTLSKDSQVKVLKVEGDWCFISTIDMKGYIPMNCIAARNQKIVQMPESNQFTKQQLLANLNFDMDLRNPSGLTVEQFKKILSNDSNDKNKVFEENAEYFYYAEKQYNINGVFIAAIGVHESAWGTSTISKNKKNLFGYGAVDSNPYGGAYSFETYGEGIDLLARVLVKYYINPPGTIIYDGTTAGGKFYNGSTISAVNQRYASDKNWANSVYKWMQYLYNKL